MLRFSKYFFVFCFLQTFPSFSQTHVSGVVSGIWNSEGSPYILDSTIVIPQNTILLINPGVTIRIGAQDSIKVYGSFSALGSETDSVFFLPAEGDTSWKLIYFYPTSDDSNSFSYCRFEESGGYLIKSADCSQIYSNCTFKSYEYSLVFDNNNGRIISCVFITDAWAIVSSWGSNMLIDGNDFSQSGQGIDGYGASGTITNNVMNNSNWFISMSAISGMTIANNNIGGVIDLSGSNCIISENTIEGDVYIYGSGMTLSSNTIAEQVRFYASNSQVVGNIMTYSGSWTLYLDDAINVLIKDNQITDYIHTWECDELTIRDNTLQGINSSSDQDIYVIKNTFSNGSITVLDNAHFQVDSNYINGGLETGEESLVEARNNELIWLSGDYVSKMVWTEGTLIFENNTIKCESYSTFITDLVYVESAGDLTLRNNIIIGDNVNSVGLKVESGGIVDNSYNCFWKCDTVYVGCSAGTGEFYGNPYLIEGNPFDAGLQAISPCIDAGYPWGVGDPDGTVKDMGFQFFDNRIDHPPTVYSDTASLASLGQEYGYWAKTSDDGNTVTFNFEGLPDWLNPSGILTVADSVLLEGNVPAGQPDFDYLIRVEDSAGQIDTQRVFVETVPYTVLSGIRTGILPVGNSPYLMVGDVTVPAGEGLTIEPGVEIYARKHYEPDGLFTLKVYGQIIAEGMAEDTIVFASAEAEPDYDDWGGIKFINCRDDTSVISYCRVENAKYGGVNADSSMSYIINENTFQGNYFGILIINGSSGKITSNFFTDNQSYSIYLENSNPDISNNSLSDQENTGIMLFNSNCYIHDNIFNGFSGININTDACPLITWNIFINLIAGAISVSNNAAPIIANNIVYECNSGFYIIYNSIPVVENNIIVNNNDYGIFLFSINPFNDTLSIKFNTIWNNQGGDFINFPEFYGSYSEINTNGDSCDIFFNISEDPLFEGGEPFSFILQNGSPCIDAGNPDTAYYDNEDPANPGFALYPAKGTIINDMGRYGGHGTSFWTEVNLWDNINTPKSITLRQNYPNPFNSATRIEFYLPYSAYLELTIYNIMGKEVISLWDGKLEAGEFSFVWDASNAASGVYFASLKAENFRTVKKMLLVK